MPAKRGKCSGCGCEDVDLVALVGGWQRICDNCMYELEVGPAVLKPAPRPKPSREELLHPQDEHLFPLPAPAPKEKRTR